MKPIVTALAGRMGDAVPLWLMRQAGRYLPEYREVRSQYAGFLDLVYDPVAAAEITMQPVRRFGMDGAILFSDILVVPDALGQKVSFEEGQGPRLEPLRPGTDLARLDRVRTRERFSSICETIDLVQGKLASEGMDNTALIGFAGSPWTVACYMVEGSGSRDFLQTRLWAYRDPDGFGELMRVIEDATVEYLCLQIEAGAEIIQLFDSWAGILDSTQFGLWVIGPTRRICDSVRRLYPEVPIIGFPKGSGHLAVKYMQEAGVTALSLDAGTPVRWAANVLQQTMPVQGNLDPLCLLAGGDALILELENIFAHLGRGPFVFNLGHGIHKDTPLEHVELLVEVVRSWKV